MLRARNHLVCLFDTPYYDITSRCVQRALNGQRDRGRPRPCEYSRFVFAIAVTQSPGAIWDERSSPEGPATRCCRSPNPSIIVLTGLLRRLCLLAKTCGGACPIEKGSNRLLSHLAGRPHVETQVSSGVGQIFLFGRLEFGET